jgi:hypothetical protein
VSILLSIPRGQFIGSSIENILFILGGVYVIWLWPRRLRHRVEAGKTSNTKAQAQLKKFNPKWGYVFVVVGVGRIILDLTA